jgi:8-oxo-dGTP diphosphatase
MPVLVVAAVCFDGPRVLITRRPEGTHLAGCWEFPGGKIEAGESPEEALVREMWEECGVEVAVGPIVDVTYWRYPTKSVLLLFYEVRIMAGVLRPLGVAAWAWASRENLGDYTFPPADERVLARIRERLSALEGSG